jgi:hypothetical protein
MPALMAQTSAAVVTVMTGTAAPFWSTRADA